MGTFSGRYAEKCLCFLCSTFFSNVREASCSLEEKLARRGADRILFHRCHRTHPGMYVCVCSRLPIHVEEVDPQCHLSNISKLLIPFFYLRFPFSLHFLSYSFHLPTEHFECWELEFPH